MTIDHKDASHEISRNEKGNATSRTVVMSHEVDSSSKDVNLDICKPLVKRQSSMGVRSIREIKSEPLPLDKFVQLCTTQPPVVRAFVVTVFTGIPFVVFLLVAHFALHGKTIGPSQYGATLFQLSKWLILSWASFMGLLWLGRLLATASTWFCSLSRITLKFQRLVEAICLRMVFMIWAGVVYAIIPSIFHHSFGDEVTKTSKVSDWVATLRRAFMFLVIAFAIIFIQGILLELISIQYIGGWMGPRSKRATDALDTIKKLHNLTNPHLSPDSAGALKKLCRKLFLRFDITDKYYQISIGNGTEDIWVDYAHEIWHVIARGQTEITRIDIAQQLTLMSRDSTRGQDLFNKIDQDGNGTITLEELELLLQTLGQQLNSHARARRGVRYLLSKLEIILSVVTLGIILFLYIQFFQRGVKQDLGTFWTGLTGLSFAFGGVLLEFTNACVFVFGKHAYDVGDYIEVKGKKLIVDKIYLTHTNFEEVTDPTERGTVVQISHASLMSEPIINWTRTMEEVVENKRLKSEEDEAKETAKGEQEKIEHEEARNLLLLKTAHLRNTSATPEDAGVHVKKEECNS